MLTQTFRELSTTYVPKKITLPLASTDTIMTIISPTLISTPSFMKTTTMPSTAIMPKCEIESVLSDQNNYQDTFSFLCNRNRSILPDTPLNVQNIKPTLSLSVSRDMIENRKNPLKSDSQKKARTEKSTAKQFHCRFCAYSCKHEVSLVRHLKKLHPEYDEHPNLEAINKTNNSVNTILKCSQCDYSCTLEIVLQYHTELVHQPADTPSIFRGKECKCVYCAFTCQHIISYKRHLETRHPGKSGSHDCDKCNFSTFRFASYIHHLTVDEHQGTSTEDSSL